MKHVVWVAVTTALAAPLALAQAQPVGGMGPGLHVDIARPPSEFNGTGMQAHYAFALNPQWLLGVGLTIGSARVNAATANALGFSPPIYRASIDITPSYALSDSLQVFAKLSSPANPATALTTGSDSSFSLNGLGYGVGVRAMVDKNLFFQGSFDTNRNKDLSTPPAGTSGFSLGVGYTF